MDSKETRLLWSAEEEARCIFSFLRTCEERHEHADTTYKLREVFNNSHYPDEALTFTQLVECLRSLLNASVPYASLVSEEDLASSSLLKQHQLIARPAERSRLKQLEFDLLMRDGIESVVVAMNDRNWTIGNINISLQTHREACLAFWKCVIDVRGHLCRDEHAVRNLSCNWDSIFTSIPVDWTATVASKLVVVWRSEHKLRTRANRVVEDLNALQQKWSAVNLGSMGLPPSKQQQTSPTQVRDIESSRSIVKALCTEEDMWRSLKSVSDEIPPPDTTDSSECTKSNQSSLSTGASNTTSLSASLSRREFSALELLRSCIESGDVKTVAFLCQAFNFEPDENLLLDAVNLGQLDVVRLFVTFGADTNVIGRHGNNALHQAAALNEWEILMYLVLEGHADINGRNNSGKTALSLAVQGSHNIELGTWSSILTLPTSGHSAREQRLGVKSRGKRSSQECVYFLVEHGADIEPTPLHSGPFTLSFLTPDKLTPLDRAFRVLNAEIVDLLMDHGARLNVHESFKALAKKPQQWATDEELDAVMEVLVKHGVNFNKEHILSQPPPIDIACSNNNAQLANCLLRHGAVMVTSVRVVPEGPLQLTWRSTALDDAVTKGDLPSVDMLCKAAERIEVPGTTARMNPSTGSSAWTSFHQAVSTRRIRAVEMLLSSLGGAAVNILCGEWTPLSIAARLGEHRMFRSLLPHATEENKTRAMRVAQQYGHFHLMNKTPTTLVDLSTSAQKLGGGGCGAVYKVERPNDTPIAMKIANHDIQGRFSLRAEYESMMLLQHPHIVSALDIAPDGTCLAIEYMDAGDLQHYAKQKEGGTLPLHEAGFLMKQALQALDFMHSAIHTDPYGREKCYAVHHDLKEHNLLLTRKAANGELILKVGDLGMVMFKNRLEEFEVGWAGTPAYLAPESTENESGDCEYHRSSDIFSLAKTFIKLLTPLSDHDFAISQQLGMQHLFLKSPESSSDENKDCDYAVRLVPNDNDSTVPSSSQFFALLQCCTNEDPAQRPSAHKLLNTFFFRAVPNPTPSENASLQKNAAVLCNSYVHNNEPPMSSQQVASLHCVPEASVSKVKTNDSCTTSLCCTYYTIGEFNRSSSSV